MEKGNEQSLRTPYVNYCLNLPVKTSFCYFETIKLILKFMFSFLPLRMLI